MRGTGEQVQTLLQGIFAWGQHLPTTGLYVFIFAWLFVESTGFPISDEPLLLLAGYLATQGRVTLVLVIVIALVGKVLASCCAYWLGQRISLQRLARPATPPVAGWHRWTYRIRPTAAMVHVVEERFRRQGVWGVFLGRLIPVVRSFISYPAGAAAMPFARFLLATTAGSILWILCWTLLGSALGRSYQVALARWGTLSWVVLAGALVLLGAALLWRHQRG